MLAPMWWHHGARKLRSVIARPKHSNCRSVNRSFCSGRRSTDSSALAVSDPQVALEAPITPYTTPTGGGAPAAISTTTLGFTPQTGDPSFNSRGLPCSYSGGTCTSNGFIAYYKDDRISSSSGWSAISISPAGRIKRWFWNESAWTD